VLATTPV